MFIKDWKKEIFTIPNLLSLFRLLLIPVYVIIYLNAEDTMDYLLSGAILAVSCLTDLIDGKIARRYNMISTVGKILDPFADKATQFALTICLALKYPILWYLLGLFIVKESFQIIAGGISLKHGKMLNGALISGKICTTVLFISLIFMILIPQLSSGMVLFLTIIDIVCMVVAFIDYILAYCRPGSRFQTIVETNKKDPEV